MEETGQTGAAPSGGTGDEVPQVEADRLKPLEERPSMSYWAIVYSQFRKNGFAVNSLRVLLLLFLVATYAPLLSFRYPFVYRDGLRQSLDAGDSVEVGPVSLDVVFGPPPDLGSGPEIAAIKGASTADGYYLVRKGGGFTRARQGISVGHRDKCTFTEQGGGLAPEHAVFGMAGGRPFVRDVSGNRTVKVNGQLLGETTYPFFAALFNANEFELSVDRFFNLFMFVLPVLALLYLGMRLLSRLPAATSLQAVAALAAVVSGLGIAWILWVPFKAPYRDYQAELAADKADLATMNPLVRSESSFGVFPPIRRAYRDQNPSIYFKGPLREIEVKSYLSPFLPENTEVVGGGRKVRLISLGYLCGTDEIGRDVFSRLLYGTRISLTIGVFAVAIYVAIGILVGGVAGFFGGWVDIFVQRIIEIMMCFPVFFLILTIIAILETRSIFMIMAVIGITSWTGVARLVRGEFLKQKTIDYVTAAKALGVNRVRIMFKHILPNAMAPVLVAATFGIASAILTETSLSFLGLGDVRAPSWGQILVAGRLSGELYLILIAGFAIFFTVTVLNLVGEGARDALDPKLRR